MYEYLFCMARTEALTIFISKPEKYVLCIFIVNKAFILSKDLGWAQNKESPKGYIMKLKPWESQ